jgi:hypothetical protein
VNPDLGAYTFRVVNEGGDVNSTMTIRITVPAGFEITGQEGVHAPRISNGDRTLAGQTITDANVVVTFSPVDEHNWMFWPLLISVLISVILVGAWAVFHFRTSGEEEMFQGQEKPPGP